MPGKIRVILRLFILSLILLIPAFTKLAPPARAQTTEPVTVTITRFIQIQNPDGGLIGDGDYYGKVQIDGFGFQDNRGVALDFSTSHVDQSPFWSFTQQVDLSLSTIPIDIMVLDADCAGVFPFCGAGPL